MSEHKLMQRFTATDMQRRSSAILDCADASPVLITRNCEEFILMGKKTYEAMAQKEEQK